MVEDALGLVPKNLGMRTLALSKSLMYTGEGLLLPLIELLVTRKRPRLPTDDPDFFKVARESMRELIECDIARIERGVYPRDVLTHEPLLRHVLRIPRLFRAGLRA